MTRWLIDAARLLLAVLVGGALAEFGARRHLHRSGRCPVCEPEPANAEGTARLVATLLGKS